MLEWLLNDECSVEVVEENSLYGDFSYSSPVKYRCKVVEEKVFNFDSSSAMVTTRKVYKIRSSELNGAVITVGSRIDGEFLVKSVRMFKDINGNDLYLKITAE